MKSLWKQKIDFDNIEQGNVERIERKRENGGGRKE